MAGSNLDLPNTRREPPAGSIRTRRRRRDVLRQFLNPDGVQQRAVFDSLHAAALGIRIHSDVDALPEHDDLVRMADVVRLPGRQMNAQRTNGRVRRSSESASARMRHLDLPADAFV